MTNLKRLRELNSELEEYETQEIVKEQFYQAFLQSPIPIALIALDGSWMHVNHRVPRMLGYRKQELLELTFQDVTHPEDLKLDLQFLELLFNKEIKTYSMHKRYQHKSGKIIHVKLTVTPVLDDDGKIAFYISQILPLEEGQFKQGYSYYK